VVARSIHAASPRRFMPLVTIHCGALTETLLESELVRPRERFVHGRAVPQEGQVEVADGGSVFLDEIGDISLRTQTDLLRVLQEKGNRTGGRQPADQGGFSLYRRHQQKPGGTGEGRLLPSGLYYRLHVFCIEPGRRCASGGRIFRCW